MAKKQKQGKGGGARKYGRHKLHCMKYRAEGRREKNKARKQRKIQRERERKNERSDR